MPQQITILDYGMGNLHSILKKISHLNVKTIISSEPEGILKADKIIFPGVGHFQKAIQNLNSLNLIDVLNEAVHIKKKPILGICLGMQIMANYSSEGNVPGLGWIDADIIKFDIKDKLKYKVPHMGWNQVLIKKDSQLMKNIEHRSEFYFVHSYHFKPNNDSDILNETEYEYIFTSAIEKENIFGVQYHPEKSHDTGERLFKNYIEL